MKNLKSIVFFGTHELAVPALETLAELEALPRLIVTRPTVGVSRAAFGDRSDRVAHPVKEWAKEHGVDVKTSRRALEPDLQERIAKLAPDLVLAADYGRPIPLEIIEMASRDALELQPSNLPKLRGEHALRTALVNGDNKTGVTVFRLEEEPWAGPIVMQEELPIEKHETFGELLPRAEELGKELLAKVLEKVDKSKKPPAGKKQNEKSATTTIRIDPRHRKAPWSMKAEGIYNRLRAYTPGGLDSYCKRRPIEILNGMPMGWVQESYGVTGTYLGMRQGKLAVLAGESTVFGISRLRRPDGEVQGASEFARFEQLEIGDRFV